MYKSPSPTARILLPCSLSLVYSNVFGSFFAPSYAPISSSLVYPSILLPFTPPLLYDLAVEPFFDVNGGNRISMETSFEMILSRVYQSMQTFTIRIEPLDRWAPSRKHGLQSLHSFLFVTDSLTNIFSFSLLFIPLYSIPERSSSVSHFSNSNLLLYLCI